MIDYVLDTLSRGIDFYYENNRLREIRQDRNGTIFKYAIIDYAPVTINASLQNINYYDDDGNLLFTRATPPDPANLNTTQVYLPIRVTYPNGANLRFAYTSYAQMWLIEKWVPSVTGQGAARRIGYTRFDLPSVNQVSTPTNALSNTLLTANGLGDCPTLTQRVEQAENWNNGAEKTILYGYDFNYSGTYHTVTNGVQNLRLYYTALTRALVTMDSGWSNSLKEEKVTCTSDSGVSYPSNPRVTETKITDYQAGAARRAIIGYTQQNGVWLPTTKDEYQSNNTVYRRSETTYTSYPTQRIIGLPSQLSVYAGAGTTLLARTSTSYDETGTFTDVNNNPWNFLSAVNGLTQHDDANYGGSFTPRGSPTSVTQSSVVNGAITATRVISRTSWDSSGNVHGGVDGAGNPKGFGYGDNFLNKPASVGQTGAYMTISVDVVGFVKAANFDYYTGQVGTSYNVRPGSSVAEQLVTTTYDFADRPVQTTRPDGGWVKSDYWDNLLYATTFQKTDTVSGVDQVGFSFKLSDGAGRNIRRGSDHPNAITGKYSGQKSVYDVNGRQSDASNVTAMDANWTPIDEDAATGWLFKNYAYDAMGKMKTFTDIDGTTIQKDYLGFGCAGGASVTTTDQRRCKVKTSTDFLGRLSQSSEFNAANVDLNGNYNNAIYTYDVLII